ncbi:MAG: 50S ribosomal protein L10 [Hyphomicrobiaceae bacterium]|nr:50S ribosomal protein L10 [Hyphomicrobiaceae bacterium]
MEREQKRELVKSLHEVFSDTGVIVVAHNTGMTVAEITDLRAQVREVGGAVKVAKNRLVKLALKDTPAESLSDLFTGPTIIAYADDPVSVPKVAVKFAKTNEKLVLLGGAMGEMYLDIDGVKSLAALPTLDELRGTLVGLLQAPAGKVARVISTPPGQLARVISAYSEKSDAA